MGRYTTHLISRYNAGQSALTLVCIFSSVFTSFIAGQDTATDQTPLANSILPLVKKYCFECHSSELAEAEINFENWKNEATIRGRLNELQKFHEIVRGSQMPPIDSAQPTDAERKKLSDWSKEFLLVEAQTYAGDPGPVVLRRLSNAEFNYTIQDITGIASLNPTKEFPIDGAAGEGFTNTGNALGMSPALFRKYMDAAKQISDHAVLLPDGIGFAKQTTERDRVDDYLNRIRDFYKTFTVESGDTAIDLQGIKFSTNSGGRLPVHSYVKATLEYRDRLKQNQTTIEQIAKVNGLSPKYLRRLWKLFIDEPSVGDSSENASFVIAEIRAAWKLATPDEAEQISKQIIFWQEKLWKFNVVGQIGRSNGPKVWQEPTNPIQMVQEFRIPVDAAFKSDVSLVLGSNSLYSEKETWTRWKRPRLTGGGKPDLLLRDLKDLVANGNQIRRKMLSKTASFLRAANAVQVWRKSVAEKVLSAPSEKLNSNDSNKQFESKINSIAEQYNVDATQLRIWLDYLRIQDSKPVQVNGHFTKTERNSNGYAFINGWGTGATPSVIANSSDNQVRIPGISKPHSVVVHPSPELFVACGWQSPITGEVQVTADIADHHPECGNGVEWILQHQSGRIPTPIWRGQIDVTKQSSMKAVKLRVRQGDLISFIVGPHQRSHSCDLTQINLKIASSDSTWDLAADVSSNILQSNPHADRLGNQRVWHFYKGKWSNAVSSIQNKTRIPNGSYLDIWQKSSSTAERNSLAVKIADLVASTNTEISIANGQLVQQIRELVDPFLNAALSSTASPDPRFQSGPSGSNQPSADLFTKAGETIEFKIPLSLLKGREFVVSAEVADANSAAAQALFAQFVPTPREGLSLEKVFKRGSQSKSICAPNETAKRIATKAFDDFRQVFPAAICYPTIVPVDEVVTSTLYHREDLFLKNLFLSESEKTLLDRLWDEMLFVGKEPLKRQIALEQIHQFATQDRPDLVPQFKALFPLCAEQVKAFGERQRELEPVQLSSAISFADKAWRRPLSEKTKAELKVFYRKLRQQELSHEQSIKLVIARILVAPEFLYRREVSQPGTKFSPVTELELANRLSYFLWSSAPDGRLKKLATSQSKPDGLRLSNPIVLVKEAKRMVDDPKIRRLAIHFACQWLHLRDFDKNDDKNERLFPEFPKIRKDLYEETVLYFEKLIQEDRSVFEIVNSDYTYVNSGLAKLYQISFDSSGSSDVSSKTWKKVSGVNAKSRGGVLTMGSFLASQSGASRTSPILRGTWISETLLGERLPKPPANVPQLPEAVPSNLTARELIELHTSSPQCAKCHARIDPYGFALEGYDAIGRIRRNNVNTKTTLVEGLKIDGVHELQKYILEQRRDDFLRQFCKKLLGYALARETQLSDEPLIQKMILNLSNRDFRFSAAVETIITSEQFLNIRDQEYARN